MVDVINASPFQAARVIIPRKANSAPLPVKLQHAHEPVGIITLKNRQLSPAAQLFIETARDVAKPLAR